MSITEERDKVIDFTQAYYPPAPSFYVALDGANANLKSGVIAAQTGIAGSTKIGNNLVVGGQVGIAGHLKIGNNVIIGAGSVIVKDVPNDHIEPTKNMDSWREHIFTPWFKPEDLYILKSSCIRSGCRYRSENE